MDNERIRKLVFAAVDGKISDEDFELLQNLLESNPLARNEYLRSVQLCESLAEIADQEAEPAVIKRNDSSAELPRKPTARTKALPLKASWNWCTSLIAAALLLLVGSAAFWLGRLNHRTDPALSQTEDSGRKSPEREEQRIAGHATLRRVVDLAWSNNAESHHEGDVLPNGVIAFDQGVVEMDFFCGATLIVEGPAKLDIESDWSVRVAEGRLRATVPPAARGFSVRVADSEIIDLGTEFAVQVGDGRAQVEVIDGEVKLLGGEFDGQHLTTGESQALLGEQTETSVSQDLSTVEDIERRQRVAEKRRFEQWKNHAQELRGDPRLIAYFPIAASQKGRVVTETSHHAKELDGLLVGPVDRRQGRFGEQSLGLGFDRPAARVRTRIDGQFNAFTFICWVRIDSLEHRYNALFMADSYENGEPHWQIRDDGRLMFSVMVDDTQEVKFFNQREQRFVHDAGLHRVYLTEPVWDLSQSGQWFHLAAVYDPGNRSVDQYVNGERIFTERIIDKFHIESLSIGAAEIGNWGQPFRNSAWFAVRNLNGTIDELAIFDAALNAAEISKLYEQGKPLGY